MEEMVSIIVPTYNREQYISRAVQSILRQTYDKYEVIVVDDGSTDNTQEIVKKLQEKDDRIRYIVSERNQGVAHARNIGIQEAKYDYIAFLDSDDEWLPEKLQLQMEKMMESSEQVGFVYCRTSGNNRNGNGGNGNGRFICPFPEIPLNMLEGDLFLLLLKTNVIGQMSILARKECLLQSGGFKESLRALEDWELFIRIAKDWQIGFVDEVLVEVHSLPDSISTDVGGFLVTRCYMVSKYRKQMSDAGILDSIIGSILNIACQCGKQKETEELLSMDFEL